MPHSQTVTDKVTDTDSDVLIIGCGLAGMTLALSLPPTLRITLLSKGAAHECASAWAQGGIAAVLDASDSIEAHVQDTLTAGAGLCDETAVRRILEQGPAAIEWLLGHDVPFTTEVNGQLHKLHLTREGGHSARRIAHAADRTGHAVHQRLLQACKLRKHITLLEHCTATDLLQDAQQRCIGAAVRHADGRVQQLRASHTALATGGMGQIYASTTTPTCATGDGIAMAWRAGCAVRDLEFMQFHPTALHIHGKAVGLISEALRGEGALLYLPKKDGNPGERFMLRHDPRAELAPRDIVSRAIDAEMRERHLPYVLLDITHQSREWLAHHFPGVMALCAAHGIDIATQAIPVAPCAHYTCGGVQAYVNGRTSMAGLWAIGEVARTGLHGANRLASNSLLECVVMGRAAAHAMAAQPLPKHCIIHSSKRNEPKGLSPITPLEMQQSLQQLMQQNVGIVRSNHSLITAAKQLVLWRAQWRAADHAVRNQLTLCSLMVDAALQRHVSAGAHYNLDWPALEEATA
ncbi:L-aspartate oxidase [Comamonas sp. Y33R10-2]|uniref:L-aspartate oxidase n=1 Tax=Comamonas sp. Y33R10-2 TaxID=2853257 RepID=UPI001C5CB1E1|nr:L-aspartate oxidase [Comamonas sp. Y33R10-2]QXZ09632.1 L-aspartate oxidase [Comamonas sp. Y33R10-2]